MNKLTINEVKSLLKQRDANSNKSDYGHALIVAGKKGTIGAAVIAAKAALRAGAGLLTVCVPADERLILQTAVPEAMLFLREENQTRLDHFSAIGIGPGIGTDKTTEEWLLEIMTEFKGPLLLDADAITIISNNEKVLDAIPDKTIITPHTGEFDRLFGFHQNNDDRIATAIRKSLQYNIIIVLKGHHTAIISADEVSYNTSGNAGLAKGGSGDALTGVITSFLAQGYAPINAAKLGVYLHGLAADLTLQGQSMESMVITDVINNFGNAFELIRA